MPKLFTRLGAFLLVIITIFIPVQPLQAQSSVSPTDIFNIEVEMNQTQRLAFANPIEFLDSQRGFLSIDDNELVVNPTHKRVLGEHVVEVRDAVTSDVHQVNINVLLPAVDWDELRNKLKNILGDKVSKYGIKVIDLKRNQEFSINGLKKLPPASISKVPVAVLALKDIDNSVLAFEDEYPIKAENKPYTHDRMASYENGTMVSVQQYLEYSIIYSDNTANATLEDMLGGQEVVNQRIQDELGVNSFFRRPHEAKANAVAQVFAGIVNREYLSESNSKYLNRLLLNTASWLQDGIPARLPEGVTVAHKTGQLPFYVWEDAGIVYGEDTNFVIVFLNNDITYKQARSFTRRASRITYEYLNNVD